LNRLLEQIDLVQGTIAGSNSRVELQALLVEDDSNERELLAGLLRMSGYNVVTARDGLDALEYLNTHNRPDVVLLDMRMPRCDGPTTIERIRANPNTADLRVFAVSGTSPSELGISTGAGGVDGWFAKPLNPETLARQIRHIAQTASA
jgi:CheY-like chemotaxis protein